MDYHSREITISPFTKIHKSRYQPYSRKFLYRPHMNIPVKERSPSPPVTGVQITSLYPEILALIFSYLDVDDRGRAAQVCTTWRDASYFKSVWKGVEAKLHLRRTNQNLFNSLVRRGIKKVQILSLKRSLRDVTTGIYALTSLNLSGCYNLKDDALICAFATEIRTLSNLNLSLCKQITDKSLIRVAQAAKNLISLDLGGCSLISDSSLYMISANLKKLKILNLRSCWNISDTGIAQLAGQTDKSCGIETLEHLSLQDCQHLTDECLKYISLGFHSLKYINLSFCIGITDNGLKYISKIQSLQHLNLRSSDTISDVGIAYLSESASSSLTTLDVSFCVRVTDCSLNHIADGLYNIKCLSLSACKVSDLGISKIGKSLTDLEELHIGQCRKLTDSSLRIINDSFKNLKCIDLYGISNITPSGISLVMQLPKLSNLNLGL